jgi:hypothetical protein
MKSFIPLCLAVLLLTGCAMTDRNHLSTTNAFRRAVTTESGNGGWVAVLAFPITFTIDNLIITPIAHTASAWNDAADMVAEASEEYHGYNQFHYEPYALIAPLTGHLLSPVYFLSSLTHRAIAADPPRSDAQWDWPEWGRADVPIRKHPLAP